MSDLRRRWDGLFDEVGSLRALALVRLLFGPIVVFHLWGFLWPALEGRTYQDRFHEPFWSWLPHPAETVYAAAMVVGVLAGVAMTIGLGSRAATVVAFAVVGYNLLLDQTEFQHNRAFLLMNLGMLALQPTGRALSVDAWRHRRRHGCPPDDQGLLWPLHLHRLLLTSVYLSSGVSKILDPDWASGLVLWDRVVRYQHELTGLPFGGVLVDVLTARDLYRVFSPVVLATELFIGLGLWHGRVRLTAVWVAVVFHVSIELTANVHTFSYTALAALAVWTVPVARDRIVLVPERAATGWLHHLDWLARFRVRRDPTVSGLVLIDRDAYRYEGNEARRRVLLRLPLTFFFVAPIPSEPESEIEGEPSEPVHHG